MKRPVSLLLSVLLGVSGFTLWQSGLCFSTSEVTVEEVGVLEEWTFTEDIREHASSLDAELAALRRLRAATEPVSEALVKGELRLSDAADQLKMLAEKYYPCYLEMVEYSKTAGSLKVKLARILVRKLEVDSTVPRNLIRRLENELKVLVDHDEQPAITECVSRVSPTE